MELTTDTSSPRPGAVAETAAARVALTRADVMSAREVAVLLGLPASTVYELARRGVLPGCKLGRTWRFLRPAIEAALQAD
jgi:excisionase family DNA binding protein